MHKIKWAHGHGQKIFVDYFLASLTEKCILALLTILAIIANTLYNNVVLFFFYNEGITKFS